ncbi:Uncharacterised protein [uncultured archaeon]|nr:Uncharacterised protein [uncultured archaeon]
MSDRFTPKGLSVIDQALRISLRSFSGVPSAVASMMPKPPASETGAARTDLPNPPKAPWIIGYLQPNSSVTRVFHSKWLPPGFAQQLTTSFEADPAPWRR